jgi:hypothetical protein
VIQIVKLRQIVGRFARLPKMDSAGAGIIDAERALAAYCSKADRANAARRKKKIRRDQAAPAGRPAPNRRRRRRNDDAQIHPDSFCS